MQHSQQPPQPMLTMMPPFPTANITTEQIQKFLDENKKLILAILDNQNLGKLAECAHYQARLQQNLMYLAAIADAQPQTPTAPSQMPPHAVMQHGGHYMQNPQMAAQQPMFPQKFPMQFNPQQMHDQQQLQQQLQLHHQHQQANQAHLGMRLGPNSGIHAMHSEATTLSGLSSAPGLVDFSHGGAPSGSLDGRGSKQDAGAATSEAGSGDGHGSSGAGGNVDLEPSYLKGSEEGVN
ncbi:GRF1-interacting factor 2-like [Tasmannia lanceolata]|uniref:GRF1-interacting factor 2-like n=1 Tax=Tasmannia lanceolata TaxID=3420 RepID=UPI00406489FD